jgi:predicted Zn-dependent protease
MPAIITCPGCRRRLRLPEGCPGDTFQCPACQAHITPDEVLPDTGVALSPDRSAAPPFAGPGRRGAGRPTMSPDPRDRGPADGSPRRGWLLLSAMLGGAVLAAGVGALVVLALAGNRGAPSPTSPPARAEENQEERRQELREAFGGQKPPALEDVEQELKSLFEDLGAAYRASKGEAILAYYDLDRLADEIASTGAIPLPDANAKRAFVQGARQGMAATLQAQSPAMQWTATEIRNIKRLNNEEAVVIARHQGPNEAPLKLRWWVIRRAGAWKVYDMEVLDMGIRISTTAASFAGRGGGDLAEIRQAIAALGEAAKAAQLGDLDTAEKKLKQAERAKLSNSLEAVRLLMVGVVQLDRGRPKEALETLDRAEKLSADMPMLGFLEGMALNRLGRWEEALKHLEAYRDLLGEDAVVCFQLGESLRGLRRFPEAAAAHRKSLDYNPKNVEAFLALLHSLGGNDNKDDVGMRFARLDDPRGRFIVLAQDCERRKFDALLEPIARSMRQLDPEFAPASYYLALCKARAGQADQAAPLFQTALAKEPDERRQGEYAEGFLQAMASAGKFADAYEAAPDPAGAFRFLAGEAKKHYRTEELKRLTAAHGKKRPDDALLPWYQAEVYVQEGRYPLAEKAFAAALAKAPDEETLKSFRASRVLARHYAGRDLSAYREIGPQSETFFQLASLLFNEEKDGDLEALLEAHARNDPDGADAPLFRCRLNIRQDQTAEGIALFKEALAKAKTDEKRDEIVGDVLPDFVGAGKAAEGYQAAPDAKKAFLLAADQLMEEGRLEDLPRLVEAHRGRAPADPWLAYYQGEVFLEAKAWDKAVQVLKEGMKAAPKDQQDSFRWKYVFAMYKAGRALDAYNEVEPRDKTFTQLAGLLAGDQKGAELEALIDAHRPNAGDHPDLWFYAARAKALLKRTDEAAGLLQKACEKQPLEAQRKRYVREVVLGLLDAGLALEGYRAAPDKSAALEALAPRLVFQKKDKELADLLGEHAKDHAGEPLCQYYLGELNLLRGDPKQAGKHFAAALAEGTLADRWRFRDGLFRARVREGRAAEAYRKNEPGAETFEALAGLCLREKDAKQLQALIDAHRQSGAEAPEDLPAWELEVLWLNQDYEGALKLLAERREDVFSLPRHRWKADDYRVRCLVRLKRADEAVREAEEVASGGAGNRVLQVLALAAAGDVKKTTAVVEKMRPKPYFLRSCYQDADLGPLLRGEPFRDFREKFPEPKDEEGRAGADPDGR